MHRRVEEIRDRFIEEVGRLGESLGLNRMTCQMYGLLYLADSPLSLTEMSRLLHISKGSASLNIRKLQEWGAVKPVWRKGSNQNYYQANHDLWEIAKRRVKLGVEKRLDAIQESVAELTAKAKENNNGFSPTDTKLLKIYSRHLNEVKKFSEKTKQLLNLF